VIGQDQKILLFVARAGSTIFGLGLGLGSHFFQIFKKIFGSGQKVPGLRGVGLLFTAGQMYAWVGSGPIFKRDPLLRKYS